MYSVFFTETKLFKPVHPVQLSQTDRCRASWSSSGTPDTNEKNYKKNIYNMICGLRLVVYQKYNDKTMQVTPEDLKDLRKTDDDRISV